MAQDITNVSVTKDAYECTITVDCAVFGFQDGVLKLLLVQKLAEPFKGYWLLPGGIMKEGQTGEEAIDNVLLSLTGLKNVHQEQVHCYTEVHRHPLKRVITICYYGLINPENHPIIKQKHVKGVEWFRLDELPEIGFDHSGLIKDALALLKSNVEERLILGELLPVKFTLTELQELYEALLDEKLDRRNFRKKVLQMDLLVNTKEKKVGVKGGRPDLYTFKNK